MASSRSSRRAVGGGATQPTAAPTTRPQQQPTAQQQAGDRGQTQTQTNGSDDSGGLSTAITIVIGAAVMFALIGLFSLLVMHFLRNQRKGAT